MAVKITEWISSSGQAFPRIEATGENLSAAFQAAAEGFFSCFTELDRIRPLEKVVIHCESSDTDWLFSDWLNTLVYEVRERRMLFSRYDIHVEGIHIRGAIYGEKIDPSRHVLKKEWMAGAAFDLLYAHEGDPVQGTAAVASAVLNDVERHPLPLQEIWGAS